jgi:hypothetical protein
MDGTEPVAMRVVRAVARAEGCAPIELTPPLADVVDPDALDRLVDGRAIDCRVTFDDAGHRVRVDGGGTVAVDPDDPTAQRTER